MSSLNTNWSDLLVQILNVIALVIAIYCLFSIPSEIIRRFRLKRKGEPVSPMLLILKQLLKNWVLCALVIIPISSLISYFSLSNAGASGREIYVELITKVFVGNILTTLFFAYALSKATKEKWRNPQLANEKSKMKKMAQWYNSKTDRQVVILRIFMLGLSAVPMVGWVFFAPWVIPLLLFLEFHRIPDKEKNKSAVDLT